MFRNKIPQEAVPLSQVIEEHIGKVHRIQLNEHDENVFSVQMLDRIIPRASIDVIETKYGYRLIRIDMQTATLIFRRVVQE